MTLDLVTSCTGVLIHYYCNWCSCNFHNLLVDSLKKLETSSTSLFLSFPFSDCVRARCNCNLLHSCSVITLLYSRSIFRCLIQHLNNVNILFRIFDSLKILVGEIIYCVCSDLFLGMGLRASLFFIFIFMVDKPHSRNFCNNLKNACWLLGVNPNRNYNAFLDLYSAGSYK